ncbi:MAG: YbhB/YbcL family Raf kinase inhibitor-like protein [Pseudomonadota bacterium]
MKARLSAVIFSVLALFAFNISRAADGAPPVIMTVTTNAFEDGDIIPLKYTSHGDNIQPAFTISGAPATAVSYAIIFHDMEVARGGNPDDVLHWLAWNIPSATIAEGSLPEGSVQGPNVRGTNVYMGPGAANAKYNHYVFEFFALSENLDLPTTATREDVLAAIRGKIVGKAVYVGRFSRGML